MSDKELNEVLGYEDVRMELDEGTRAAAIREWYEDRTSRDAVFDWNDR